VKFTMNSAALAETIAAAITSLPTKPTVPILGGVLVEAQLGAVQFSSFNYDRATMRVAAADIAETDTVLVAGRLLATVGSNLPANTECHVTASGSEMVIAAPRTEFRLPLLHAADYPRLPEMASKDAIGTVDAESFCEAVRVIGGFASPDPAPVNLTVLNIACEPGDMFLCATDRYIIGRRRIDWTGATDATINVPAADILATIKAVAGNGAESIEILWNDSTLGLRTPSTTVVSRVLGEEFPDVDRIMHVDSFHCAATVETAELASMLKRAASIADDKFAQVDITVEADALSVTTTRSTAGNIVDTTPAVRHGGARRVALSSRRLHNALAAIDHDQVTLGFQKHGHLISIYPGAIEPRGTQLPPPQRDTTAALMGIRATS
jgi:DNA polymerase-3 subunit beta